MSTIRDSYASLGQGYAHRRRPDPRIAKIIKTVLGPARSVINVGAGTGSYEPDDRRVLAIEPSATMIRQRPAGSAPVVRATAEDLPVLDDSFDAGLAILTVHHWSDLTAGLSELRRVSRRQAVLTWDVTVTSRFWLVEEYVPELVANERDLATLTATRDAFERLGAHPTVIDVPVPADCTDGFVGAFWQRPEAYLDPGIRAAMSGLMLLDQGRVGTAMRRLADDLAAGRWHERHADLLALGHLDLGYRLVVA